ncbi:MAG: branched-chain amino acid transport system substrate-binding protein [Pseudomonadota bacterium]|jgi:branched-chain amino acid transport system substrate-binding protein|nr:branched-chain amino acid transport system substrate-binding protein [Pseudomonadota bacterium]MDQ5881761.1 branched-chain amino acid transport system substrate-binding protein [Pseudomonadota bacterium]MDQ5904197.1 branched-chain amino acid transport system substrate-binding protein [Pseudomonadota bacterium]MDQ5906416.1 branched-chain amino acid transport system substrate-binding protein [Pseudomonadota bacterium]MDQ5916273.1 branched-chain amino acid transport system substrate-binding pro
MQMKAKLLLTAVAVASALTTSSVMAQANEQFVGLPSYRVGPYAAGGSGIYGGWIDYMALVNEQGGVNGVKLTWEECETEYNNARGVECYERMKKKGNSGNSVFQPLSTGITYAVLDKVAQDKIPMVTIGYGRTDASDGRVFPWVFPLLTNYWSQNTAKIKFIGAKEGGMDKLKGKKIANIYHDSAYGKETIALLDKQAAKYGFTVVHIPVSHPGNEQQSQWLKVRQEKPDWVILRGWGVMNPTAIKAAAKIGFPRDKIVGVWWSGAEEDTIPAGEAAKGFIAAGFNVGGTNYPVVKSIQDNVYKKNKGNMEDKARIGSIYYNRGVVHGIITVEAIRTAQAKYGKGQVMNGEQMRWGFEHLNIDAKRLKELGAEGFMPDLKVSCLDHEGSGKVKFQQWDGKQWKVITDWIDADKELVRPMIEESAAKYAKEKNITPRDCSKEG